MAIAVKSLAAGMKRLRRVMPAADGSSDIAMDSYAKGHDEWNLRYGSVVIGERFLMRVVLTIVPALLLITLTAVIALFVVSSHHDVRVVAVPVNGKGVQIAPSYPMGTVLAVSEAAKLDILSNWTVNAFSVSPDSIVENRYLEFVRTHATQAGYTMFTDYIRGPKKDGALSPFVRAKEGTVEIKIVRIDSISPETYQVTWTEISRDFSGREKNRKNVVGSFGVSTFSNTDPEIIAHNPFGVEITRLTLSQNIGAQP